MNPAQAKMFAYIQKQYEIQVKIYSHYLEDPKYRGNISEYTRGYIDGHFSGSILQLELLAENNKLHDMALELKALYNSASK
ncbi:hypothetical protein [Desulfolucanica intricata]|uniref:hypothetical protein n=1 Tax=Desulfolucanica intricata TaxID=1285191 RepID=UPI00082C1F54|nr:hypothetical protein [Desulfolucanica intricata]